MGKGKGVPKTPATPRIYLSKPVAARQQDDYDGSSSSASDSEDEQLLPGRSSLRHLKAHRIRFIDYKPASISSLALSPHSFNVKSFFDYATPDRELLAVGRSDGSIEVYIYIGGGETTSNSARKIGKKTLKTGNKQTWILLTILPAIANAGSVERLVWAHRGKLTPDELELFDQGPEQTAALHKLQSTPPRLFSTNGSCDILEWQWHLPVQSSAGDTRTGDLKRKITIANESVSIYDLVVNPHGTRLAAACSNGAIHLVDILDDEFAHLRTLDISSPARLLCLAYGPPLPKQQDSYLVAGCSDSSVRKWDARSGRCTAKMTVDRVAAKQQTLVWSIATTADHHIISGDSMGHVTVWDSKTNTQTKSFAAHKSDVLGLAIGPDGKSLYSASTDQRICEFTLVPSAGNRRAAWSQTSTRRVHSHDVRALTCSPHYELSHAKPPSTVPLLLSGGLDMSVQLTPCAKNFEANQEGTSIRLGPLSNSADCTFASGAGRALPYVNQPPASRLVSYAVSRDLVMLRRPDGCSIWRFTEENHARVLNLKLKGLTTTTVGGISPDGNWIVLGDLWRIKLWKLHHAETPKHKIFEQADPIKVKASKSFDALVESDPTLAAIPYLSASCVHFTSDSNYLIFATTATPHEPVQIVVLGLPQDDEPLRLVKTWALPVHATQRAIAGFSKPADKPAATNGHANGSAKANGHHANVAPVPSDLGSIAQEASDDDEHEDDARPLVSQERLHPSVCVISSSPDTKWLAVADSNRSVSVYDLKGFSFHCRLPTFPYPIADMGFLPSDPNTLIVAQKNCQLSVFDVAKKTPAAWAEAFNINNPQALSEARDELLGLAIEPKASAQQDNDLSVLLWGATFTTSLRIPSFKDIDASGPHSLKRKADQDEIRAPPTTFTSATLKHKFSDALGVDFIRHGELAVVERPFIDLLPSLPPAVYTRRYGTA